MADVTAVEKHPCAACGAQAQWNPARQRLVCPFCGTDAPYETNPSTGAIEEIDLVRTLRDMPEDLREWRPGTRTVQCRSCKAVSVFEAGGVGPKIGVFGVPPPGGYPEN